MFSVNLIVTSEVWSLPRRQSMLGKKLPKGPYGPFGTKPAGASVFISASKQMDVDALAGIVPKGP